MEFIIRSHNAVWSSTGMLLLYVGSVYALYRMRKENRRLLAVYSIIMTLLAYNPWMAKAFVFFTGDGIAYARFFWAIPVFLDLAIVFTDLIYRNKKWRKPVVACICILLCVISGELYKGGLLKLPENSYKLTQDSIDVSDIMLADADIPANALASEISERPRVVVVERDGGSYSHDGTRGNNLRFGIRQYTGLLRTGYVQQPEGSLDLSAYSMRAYLPVNADYYVVPDIDPYNYAMDAAGYPFVGRTDNYLVYRNDHRLTVFFVRHGRTEANEADIMMGSAGESPLSATGREGVSYAATTFADFAFDAVYTSDLQRTKDTAQIILDSNKAGCDRVTALASLNDADLGAMEGMSRTQASETYPDSWFGTVADASYASPSGAENAHAQFERLNDAMMQIVMENESESGANVLVAAHSNIGIWMNETLQSEAYTNMSNSAVTVMQYHDGVWEMLAFNVAGQLRGKLPLLK